MADRARRLNCGVWRAGVIHGYYRMYWGKKIVEWTPTYEDALATMIHLHDRYAKPRVNDPTRVLLLDQ